MAIYDMASAIRQPDAGNFGQGLTMGQQFAQNRRQNQARNALARLQQGDTSAMADLQMADPDAAMKWQEMQRAEETRTGLQGFFKPATGATNVVGVNSLSALANGQPAQPASYDFDGAMNYAAGRGEIDQAASLAQLRDKMRPQSAKYYGGDAQEVIGKDGQRRLIAMTEAGPVELPYQPVSKPKYKFMDDGTVIDETSAQPVGRIPVGLSPAQQLQARIAFAGQNKPQAITAADGQVYWLAPGQQLPQGIKAASAVKPEALLPDGVANARSLYGRALEADKMYGTTSTELFGPGKEYVPGLATSGVEIPLTGAKVFRSKEAKRIEPVQRNFIAAVLRKESGGAITDDEWSTYMPMYFPVYGDGPQEIATKAQLRKAALEQLKQAAQMQGKQPAQPGVRKDTSGLVNWLQGRNINNQDQFNQAVTEMKRRGWNEAEINQALDKAGL